MSFLGVLGASVNRAVESTKNAATELFSSPLLYLIPGILLVYAILVAIFSEQEWEAKIKRIYYAAMFLLLGFIIQAYDFNALAETGLWGMTSEAWSIVLFSIIWFIVTLILDSFIISGFVFKEIGIFGTRFIKEETKQMVKQQGDYILFLEAGIQALDKIIEYMKEKLADKSVKDVLRKKSFDFLEEYEKFLVQFFNYRNLETLVEVQAFDSDNYENLVSKIADTYNLKKSDIEEFYFSLEHNLRYYTQNEHYEILHVVANSKLVKNQSISITVRYKKDECNLNDQIFIKTILQHFELLLIELTAGN